MIASAGVLRHASYPGPPAPNEAVILAGGRGTRLQESLAGQPKSLVEILGVPLLERQVCELQKFGIGRLTLLVGHQADLIRKFCASRGYWGLDVRIIDDGPAKGTAGAFLNALHELSDEVLVVYGDLLFACDFGRFHAFHAQDPDAAASLMLHPCDHPQDADIVELSDDGVIRALHRYPHAPDAWLPNLCNAAIYLVRSEKLKPWHARARREVFDFAKDLFPLMVAEGARLRGYVSSEYVCDVGTPRRLQQASAALERGVPGRMSAQVPQRAVFIDRDGTLTQANGRISRPADLRLYSHSAAALQMLHKAEYRKVLVTNQAVVARGECTLAGLREIHNKLETELGREGAFLDRIYFCPHHPDGGFPNEVGALKLRCECRKPQAGMLFQAQREMHLDLSRSWLVGDCATDIGAAANAGVTSIRIGGGDSCPNDEPILADFTALDLLGAARFITATYPKLKNALLPVLQAGRQVRDFFVCAADLQLRAAAAGVLARELRLDGVPCLVLRLDRWRGEAHESDSGEEPLAWTHAAARLFNYCAQRAAAPVPLLAHCGRSIICPGVPAGTSPVLAADMRLVWEGVRVGDLACYLGRHCECISPLEI